MTHVPSPPPAALDSPTATDARGSDSAPPEAPAPDAVRTALRALATDSPTPRPAVSAFRETVADADAATACALDAVAFLRAGRLSELARAVADAETAGQTRVAAVGRRALTTLRRLDSAVGGALDGDAGDAATTHDAADGPEAAARDHFRSGHDIVLPQTDQAADR